MATQMLTEILLIGTHGLVLLRKYPESDPDTCERCGRVISIGDWAFCPHGRVRAHRIFPSFDHEGWTIDSIQAADRVERESARDAAEGRGAPIRFRAFHQDQSNYDVNTFGKSPQVPTPKASYLKPGWGKQARDREVHPAVRRIKGD